MNGETTRRATIDDVARLASVHKATVSRALNAQTQHQVNPETIKKVKRAARQLGYVPNAMARGLRTNLSMTIGVIIPDLTNPFFPPIIRGIENYLQPRGYTALLANTDGHDAIELAAVDSLIQRRVDGLIVATGHHGDQPMLQRAYDAGVRVVMVNRDAGGFPFPLVAGNDSSGVSASVTHLYELGHRDLVHIAGPLNLSTSMVRSSAFADACRALPGTRPRTVEAAALSVEAGQRSMDQVLSSGLPVTAIVANNDLIALGVLRSLRAHGLSCPDDISVVGFNDITFAEDFSPPLTSVRVPSLDMGAEAARLLLASIESGTQEPVRVSLPVSLIIRSSSGPVRG
jgi:LacI family transcriptional regulator